MKIVINSQIIVDVYGSDECVNASELMTFISTYPTFTLAEIVDKLDDLELNYESFEEVELVGSRPTTIRH